MQRQNQGPMAARVTTLFAVVCAIFASSSAPAQWTVANASAAWDAYNSNFYWTNGTLGYFYQKEPQVKDGSPNAGYLWEFACKIDMAIDVYYWEKINVPGNDTRNLDEVEALCNGFRNHFGGDELSDPATGAVTNNPWGGWTGANDDLMVAGIAFERAYVASGTTIYLQDAEGCFDEAWSRGYDTTYGGGIWWMNGYTTASTNYDDQKRSSVNWPFAILGHLLYVQNGISRYQTEAETVYEWCTNVLYSRGSGQVANYWAGPGGGGGSWVDRSYNYGFALGAAGELGNNSLCTSLASYVIENVNDTNINGYGILPKYGEAGNGFGLWNGITFRWMGIENGHGLMPAKWLPWAQENISTAWAHRNPADLCWDDFDATTSTTNLYSDDCTPMVVGMMYVPVIAPVRPFISGFVVSGGNLILSGTNGTANGTYAVLMTTNVALPFSLWTPVSTNTFSGTGAFTVTNAISGTEGFFAIEVP